MVSRRMLAWLVLLACVLPVAIAIILLVARLLASLNDASGASVLDRVALGGAIAWAVELACLIVAVGLFALDPTRRGPHE
ncbi:MAG TPA: hypothetical protein VGJ16_03950 [Pirellulales bacterium]